MKNYVKGEWRLNNYHHPYQYIVAHGGPEDNDAFPGQRKVCDIWDWDTEKGKANAHLIVSAPLLKTENERLRNALEHIIEYWNRDENSEAMSNALWHILETAEQALSPVSKKG